MPQRDATRMKKMRDRKKLGLKVVRLVLPAHLEVRAVALADRIRRRHEEKVKKDGQEDS